MFLLLQVDVIERKNALSNRVHLYGDADWGSYKVSTEEKVSQLQVQNEFGLWKLQYHSLGNCAMKKNTCFW